MAGTVSAPARNGTSALRKVRVPERATPPRSSEADGLSS